MKPLHTLCALALFSSCFFVSCSTQTKDTVSDNDSALSAGDRALVDELAFDVNLVSEIRKHTDSAFRKAEGNGDAELGFKDPANYQSFKAKKVNGLSFNLSEQMSNTILASLHDKFKDKGYIMYVSEGNLGHAPDEMTVLKTDDMFDVLRFEGTNGVNHDIFTEDIVEKLKLWNSQFGLDIFAASFDLVQARYIELPPMLEAHANETYEFCPDVVDQGTGSVEALQEQMQQSKQLYLWWD